MTLDLYSPCLCGSGKKLKWCCADHLDRVAQIWRLLQRGPRDHAEKAIRDALREHPNHALFLRMKLEAWANRRAFVNAQPEEILWDASLLIRLRPDLYIGHRVYAWASKSLEAVSQALQDLVDHIHRNNLYGAYPAHIVASYVERLSNPSVPPHWYPAFAWLFHAMHEPLRDAILDLMNGVPPGSRRPGITTCRAYLPPPERIQNPLHRQVYEDAVADLRMLRLRSMVERLEPIADAEPRTAFLLALGRRVLGLDRPDPQSSPFISVLLEAPHPTPDELFAASLEHQVLFDPWTEQVTVRRVEGVIDLKDRRPPDPDRFFNAIRSEAELVGEEITDGEASYYATHCFRFRSGSPDQPLWNNLLVLAISHPKLPDAEPREMRLRLLIAGPHDQRERWTEWFQQRVGHAENARLADMVEVELSLLPWLSLLSQQVNPLVDRRPFRQILEDVFQHAKTPLGVTFRELCDAEDGSRLKEAGYYYRQAAAFLLIRTGNFGYRPEESTWVYDAFSVEPPEFVPETAEWGLAWPAVIDVEKTPVNVLADLIAHEASRGTGVTQALLRNILQRASELDDTRLVKVSRLICSQLPKLTMLERLLGNALAFLDHAAQRGAIPEVLKSLAQATARLYQAARRGRQHELRQFGQTLRDVVTRYANGDPKEFIRRLFQAPHEFLQGHPRQDDPLIRSVVEEVAAELADALMQSGMVRRLEPDEELQTLMAVSPEEEPRQAYLDFSGLMAVLEHSGPTIAVPSQGTGGRLWVPGSEDSDDDDDEDQGKPKLWVPDNP